MPDVDIAAELYAVAQDVELNETADDSCRLPSLQLLACPHSSYLHIDTGIVEQDVFVLGRVGSIALILEFLFADGYNLAYFADLKAIGIAHGDVAVREGGNGFAFLLLLFGVGFLVVAREEQHGAWSDNQDKIKYEWRFLHV